MVARRLLDAVAAHPEKLAGLVGTTGGLAHFGWTVSSVTPLAGAGPALPAPWDALAAYAVAHPAYVAAVAVGAVLVAYGD